MAFTAFEELANSPVLDITPSSRVAVREAKIAAANLDALIEAVFPLGDFGIAYPGNSALRAAQLHVEPYQGNKEKITAPAAANLDIAVVNTVQYYLARITYETMEATQGDDPQLLLSHRWSTGGEFLTADAQGLEWSDSGLVDDDVKAGILVGTIEHHITWARVTSPPFSVIRSRMGCVNSAELNFKTGRIYPETLLFLGAELRRDILTDGALAWEVGYHFSERSVPLGNVGEDDDDHGNKVGGVSTGDQMTVGGWNHFFRSEDQDRARMSGKTGFYRLRTKTRINDTLTTSQTCEAAGGEWFDTGSAFVCRFGMQPIYQLKSFSELFVQGT
jgi:hypothetical protein